MKYLPRAEVLGKKANILVAQLIDCGAIAEGGEVHNCLTVKYREFITPLFDLCAAADALPDRQESSRR